jgi:Domain of Unknown Function (DUF1080)
LPFFIFPGFKDDTMGRCYIWPLFIFGVFGVTSAGWGVEPAGWVDMFKGKSLEGWTQKNGSAIFDVGEGFIAGKTRRDSGLSYLCTVEEYADFELEMDVRISGNVMSGIQIRSKTRTDDGHSIYDTGAVYGPQVRITRSDEKGSESGYLYYESKDGHWLTEEAKRVPHNHFKDRDWNTVRIVAQGPRIQTFINGEAIGDLTDPYIAIGIAR